VRRDIDPLRGFQRRARGSGAGDVRRDIDPNIFGFIAPERQSRIADADYKRVPARTGLSNDLDPLSAAEPKLKQTTVERGEGLGTRAHADHHAGGSG